MPMKKSDLYGSLWASCDELRGGMDASQCKDYVLFMLFIKYITDKYGNSTDFAPPVTIPKGASFNDMIALKGKSDIGDKINTQIIQLLIDANARLARSDFPDFNDPNKLGEGDAMVQRLTHLVSIFQKPKLDFSQNRADHVRTNWQMRRRLVELEQAAPADLVVRHKSFNRNNLRYMRSFSLRYPISAMQSHLLSLSHNETMVKRAESQMSQIKTQLVETRRFSQRAIDEKMGVSWN